MTDSRRTPEEGDSVPHEHGPNDRQRPKWYEPWKWENAATITNFLMAVATLFLVVVAFWNVQLTADVVGAMRLDQRPWLGYDSLVVKARDSHTSRWEPRKPREGEEFQVCFYLVNTGKTPAVGVQYNISPPVIVSYGDTLPVEPEGWLDNATGAAIFPGSTRWSHCTEPLRWTEQYASESSSQKSIFFWVKAFYCDTAGQRYWVQSGMARSLGSDEFHFGLTTFGSNPDEEEHPGCGQ